MLNRKPPYYAITILVIIAFGCMFADVISICEPTEINLGETLQPPSAKHIFGTDALGRDIFAGIWYGGKISITIGIISAIFSTFIAFIYGAIAGLNSKGIDRAFMRISEILMSIPKILLVLFLQGIIGEATIWKTAAVIAIASWMEIAKVVRSEVVQLSNCEYIHSAKLMGASFFYMLYRHFIPNIIPTIMYMIISNIVSAMAMEATLSYIGLGMPIERVTWGTMLALSKQGMLAGAWWVVLVPGAFLVITLICINEIGEFVRIKNKRNYELLTQNMEEYKF